MRQDDLMETLGTVQKQRYPQLQTIVANNHQDDTAEVVRRQFPDVKVLSLGQNIGCAARNKGVDEAAGEIVVTIDNDVRLTGEDFIDKVVEFFKRHSDAACVNFRVLDPSGNLSASDWCHPRAPDRWADTTFLTDHISEGACAFRKDPFLEVHGYSPEFFIGHEGPELHLRLLKRGYHTWYCPELQVCHYASKDARPGWRAHYYNTRNNVLLAYRHFPPGLLLQQVGLYGAMSLYHALRHRYLGAFCRGILDAVKMSRAEVRQPLNPEQRDRLRELRKNKPSVWTRTLKHLGMRQGYR
jgi:GT2 family glycosyltransferase